MLDEAADIFIYFLIYVMTLNKRKEFLDIIEETWNKDIKKISTEKELNISILELVKDIFLLNSQTSEALVYKIFNNIVAIGCFATGKSWQVIIDKFHYTALNSHLDPKEYILNFRFQGSGYIDFDRLLKWIEREREKGNIEIALGVTKTFKKFKEMSSRLNMVDFQ